MDRQVALGSLNVSVANQEGDKKSEVTKRDKTASRQEILKLLEEADDTWSASLLLISQFQPALRRFSFPRGA